MPSARAASGDRRPMRTLRRSRAAAGPISSASCFGSPGWLPFLFIAGRIYGAEALGRFAYAVLAVEFAAQLATLGLRARPRPAARQREQAAVCIVADAMLVAAFAVGVRHGHPDRCSPRRCSRPARCTAWTGCCRSRSSGDRRDRRRARRARLSPRCRRDGPRARDRRALDDQHRRLRAGLHLAATTG